MIPQFDMDRRGLLGRLLLLAGATTIPPGCALADNHNGSDFRFNAGQLASVTALADTMIPRGDSVGALDAKVPEKLEQLLRNWASDGTRDKLLDAIARIEKAARDGKGKDFAALSNEDRIAVLAPIDTAGLKNVPPPPGVKATPPFTGPFFADEGYAKLRKMIVFLFYYSQEALTKELPYTHNPGRWDPSVPVTPETRNEGGLGMF